MDIQTAREYLDGVKPRIDDRYRTMAADAEIRRNGEQVRFLGQPVTLSRILHGVSRGVFPAWKILPTFSEGRIELRA